MFAVGTAWSDLVAAPLHIVRGGCVDVAVLFEGAGGTGVVLVHS
jgi:hypothetical protein